MSSNTIIRHALRVWEYMDERAEVTEDGTRVFRGSLRQIFYDLGISMTYYSQVLSTLYNNGFAALVRKGGKASTSEVALLTPPTEELLQDLTSEAGGSIMSLTRRVETLESLVGGVNVATALQKIEEHLNNLYQLAILNNNTNREE
ncbi:MAG: hypothetical protein QXI19_07555 [Candidatus Caldarchaeum sp.]